MNRQVSESSNTFARWMETDKVDFETLHLRHGPLLKLVENLLGIVPNCDPYLEIWPTGFVTYNLMVPNFLNLPQMLFGLGAPKDLVGLALYQSSMASQCAYCSSHCCSFALRRGASPKSMLGEASPTQQAVLDIADAIGRVPDALQESHISDLKSHLSHQHAEWIVMGIAMMGFLNKFMDAVGIPLEQESIADAHAIMSPAGWTPKQHFPASAPLPASVTPPVDNLRTYLSVMRQAPGALRFDSKYLGAVPKKQLDARPYLKARSSLDETVLDRMRLVRPRRALTAMLAQNLDPDTTQIGLAAKAYAAYVFAEFVGNDHRRACAMSLASAQGIDVDPALIAALTTLSREPAPVDGSETKQAMSLLMAAGLSPKQSAAMVLVRASSTSPAENVPSLIATVTQHLSAAEVIELITWLSVQQLIHRLEVYYDLEDAIGK